MNTLKKRVEYESDAGAGLCDEIRELEADNEMLWHLISEGLWASERIDVDPKDEEFRSASRVAYASQYKETT